MSNSNQSIMVIGNSDFYQQCSAILSPYGYKLTVINKVKLVTTKKNIPDHY